MPKKKRIQKKRIAYITKQLIILLFIISLFLIFLFVIGNFQQFHDATQINIISWLRLVTITYLWLAAVHLGLSIIELIIFRVFNPGFLIFLLFSSAFIFSIRVIFTAAKRIIL